MTRKTLAGNVSKEVRAEVYKRDGYRCALCDDPRRIQVHHVISRAQGGPDTQMNLITLCPMCHLAAHGRDVRDLGHTAQYMELCCTQYLSDLYACEGIIWSPWDDTNYHWRY